MPSFVLQDLIRPVTRAEVQSSIYNVLGILGVNTTSWKPGAVVRTMIVGCSLVLSALSQLQAKVARSGFLELSDGDWLTLVAHHVYGVERIEATFATGEITLTNSGGGVYSFDPDDLIFANPTTGKSYRNVAAVSLGAAAAATVLVRATELGSESSADASTITQMTTVVLGVSCNNASALIGTDQESDAALRGRCQEKLGSLSPFGPWDAYTFAVRSATRADGTAVGVNRVRIVKDGYGTVTTYLAGQNGAIPGDPEDPDTDLGIARAAIERGAVPLGVTAVVLSATNKTIAVTYEAWMYDSSALTDEQVRDTIADAVRDFMRAQPIGGNVIGSDPGKVFRDAINAAVKNALPEIFHVVVTTPAGDTTLDPNDVAIAGTITATAIHRVPPPEGFGGSLNS